MSIKRWRKDLQVDERKSTGSEEFWAVCPCHEDHEASLHVWINDAGEVVMKCYACGATIRNVRLAMGKTHRAAKDEEPEAEKEADLERLKLMLTVDDMLECTANMIVLRAKGASNGLSKGSEETIATAILAAYFVKLQQEVSKRTKGKTVGADGFEQKEKRPGGRRRNG